MLEYILAALVAWTHQSPETLKPWASAMADVCISHEECTRLAAQAFVETRFVSWAVDQSCNDAEWRRKHGRDRSCDGGLAVGPWQVQSTRFLGASPEFQASVALEMMRHHPRLWTTWKAADAQTAWWLRAHP